MAHTCDICGQTAGLRLRVRDSNKGGQEYDLIFCNGTCQNGCIARHPDRFVIVQPQPPDGAPILLNSSRTQLVEDPYGYVPPRS